MFPRNSIRRRPSNEDDQMGEYLSFKMYDSGSNIKVASIRLNEILCDVVPMESTYIFLGRSWQFERKVTHYGVTNKFSFVHKGNKVILMLLTPRKVIKINLK
ncbi:hypothetical protein CR513_01750, partial [Mucuna pruriens]